MRRYRTLLAIFGLVGMFVCGVVYATKPTKTRLATKDANGLVLRALDAEAVGDLSTRSQLLTEAVDSSNSAAANWQSGRVAQSDGAWRTVQECVKSAQADKQLEEYLTLRASLANSVPNHIMLARWCIDHRLPNQARAHLHCVIVLAPENAMARQALGYRQVGDEWISPKKTAEVAARTARAKRSVQIYTRQLVDINQGLNSPHERIRNKAREKLMALEDADAVPAVELAFSSLNLEKSQLAIDWISRVDTLDASQALTRYSLLHPNESVRDYATSKLKDRPFHDFVPDLLEMMTSPISTMIVPSFDRRGQFNGYRQAFAKEKFKGTDILVVDRRIERISVQLNAQARPGSAGRVSDRRMENAVGRAVDLRIEAEAQAKARQEAANRYAQMQRENAESLARNARIGRVIAYVANRPETTDAKKIWDWWDEYNETGYQEYKPERYRNDGSVEYIPDYAPPPSQHECFIAGTPVMTQLGLRSIESLVAGDTVLSRNVSTGELAWKPVLQATQRPPAETMIISSDSESLCCTNGHLFWVSGTGWVKASRLKIGDVLHGAEEPCVVSEVSKSQTMPTFNLRVADNATYFVGDKLVMSHDVTARSPNHEKVPGMSRLRQLENE